MITHLQAVEFVGGPFDGHKEVVPLDFDELAGMVALPVQADGFGLSDGSRRPPRQRATSIAVYHRTWDHGVCRYCFLGAATPSGEK